MKLRSTPAGIEPRDLEAALKHFFGFESFRAKQREIIEQAVAGRDTLALMPTGAGKSLCYQLAAMLRPAPTLVLSPLIALMKDQVDNLPPAMAGQVSLINSSVEPADAANRLLALARGDYKLLYAAPERLRQRNFIAALRAAQIGLVVIDEVHCVSMWGHDFRPDYMFIRTALDDLGHPPILGLTATATPATLADIAAALGRQLEIVRTSVQRPNLRLEVEHVDGEDDRRRTLVDRVQMLEGAGIIYARARDRCEQLAALLRSKRIAALHYHAGLPAAERITAQNRFLHGNDRVVVATTAFGMGIDKPDIRWVLLYNYPDSLESYVQMVGRAGRDGAPATCLLFAGKHDAQTVRRHAAASLPTIEHLRGVYTQLKRHVVDGSASITPEALAVAAQLPEDADARVYAGLLERAGLARRRYDAGRDMQIELMTPPADTAQRIADLLRRYQEQAHERAARIIAFAESARCRHAQVAEHFGEMADTPCQQCDICVPTQPLPLSRAVAPPLPEDVAAAIVAAVEGLPWPLGERGLAATFSGAIDAPRSAQDNSAYGLLAAARPYKIKHWIAQLIESGHLEPYESRDGYRLLRVARRTNLPILTPPVLARRTGVYLAGLPDEDVQDGAAGQEALPHTFHLETDSGTAATGSTSEREVLRQLVEASPEASVLFERLRIWRAEQAKARGVSAFLILPNRTLYTIALRCPAGSYALGNIDGIGPQKLRQWGEAILALLRET